MRLEMMASSALAAGACGSCGGTVTAVLEEAVLDLEVRSAEVVYGTRRAAVHGSRVRAVVHARRSSSRIASGTLFTRLLKAERDKQCR